MRSIVVVVILLAGCGPTVAVLPVDPAPRARHATALADVAVYAHGEPARPFTEIAMLLAQGGERPALVDALRQRAADLGCDALIVDAEIRASDPHAVPRGDAPAWWARRHPAENVLVPATPHELDGTCVVYAREVAAPVR